MVYGWVAFFALLLWHIASELLHRAERKRLTNRIMAKNYQEFEYYDKKYKADLQEVELLRKEDRKLREEQAMAKELGEPEDDAVDKFIKGFEEDWGDEIDREKAKKQIKEL